MFSRLNLFVVSAFAATYVFGGFCNDKKVDCANWAKDGECASENAVRAADACAGPMTAKASVLYAPGSDALSDTTQGKQRRWPARAAASAANARLRLSAGSSCMPIADSER